MESLADQSSSQSVATVQIYDKDAADFKRKINSMENVPESSILLTMNVHGRNCSYRNNIYPFNIRDLVDSS